MTSEEANEALREGRLMDQIRSRIRWFTNQTVKQVYFRTQGPLATQPPLSVMSFMVFTEEGGVYGLELSKDPRIASEQYPVHSLNPIELNAGWIHSPSCKLLFE